MFKAFRQATRQSWGLAFVMAIEVGQMHGQDLFVAALEDSPKLSLEGGCLEMAQRVVGVPWNQCTLSSWGRFSNKKASEWSAGILYEGAGRWTRIGGQVGGHHELEQQAARMWQMSTGLESWPLVDRHAPWMDFRGSAIHETPLGFLRLEGKFAIGHGQCLGNALHDSDVLLPGNPWSWTAREVQPFAGMPPGSTPTLAEACNVVSVTKRKKPWICV